MARKWENLGWLVRTTENGEKIRVYVRKSGRSIELSRGMNRHLVHPMNAANVDGWIREIDTVWQTGLDGWQWER